MAATSHPLATATALSVLKDGGNAVDAAIAAAATLAVVEPHMTGIGGDCFAIVAEPDGSVHGLNGSGRAASRADPSWYRDNGFAAMPEFGVHSITAPGAIDAWDKLLRRFGTMGFDRLFGDAIRYAEDGFAVHARVGWDWQRYVEPLAADEGARRHCLVDEAAPPVGSRMRFPALGGTLRSIARGGAAAFYEGAIAAEITDVVRAGGGFLDEADLAAVRADWVTPISAQYGDFELLEIPPNGQGITALILLNLLGRLGPGDGPLSCLRLHTLIEAGRLAYSVRDHLVSDPSTMTVSLETLLSDAFTDALVARYDPSRRNADLSLPAVPNADTVYLTVVDRDRRVVSFINSLYDGFGSRIVTPVSGIALQNRGACFSLVQGHPNELGPGKRPMHTIIPAMAKRNDRVWAGLGVMGGAYQPMGHVQVLSNMVDYGMDPQEAIDHPRIFWNEDDGVLEAESGIPVDAMAALALRGHALRAAERPHGGAQMIVVDEANGFLIGASDPRKDGLALGW